jgi:hypothetical protein
MDQWAHLHGGCLGRQLLPVHLGQRLLRDHARHLAQHRQNKLRT